MPTPHVEPLDATLGAVVTGIEIPSLDAAAWDAIQAAFHEHALLIFPNQPMSPEDQVAFGRRFGEIEHLFGDSGWVPITNQRRDGSLLEDDTQPMQIMRGNEGWHTDSSYMPVSARASILSAQVVPEHGGQTEWADMRAAYAALDGDTRARIAPLSARHSIRYSQARIGHTDQANGGYGFNVEEPPLRPLVKKHPVTGCDALYIGRHAYGIPGVETAESESLLDGLLDFACQTPRIYRHEWQPGDIAVWDNRCTLHRARPYEHREARAMRHTRVAGDPSTESGCESSAI